MPTPTWEVSVNDDPSDSNNLIYLTATSAAHPEPLYAAARVTWKKGRQYVQLSEWQGEDGVTVDLPKLTAQVKRELQGYRKVSAKT